MLKSRCKHCGVFISPAAGAGGFCCSGCEHVYQLIHREGLDGFYGLRNGAVRPVAAGGAGEQESFDWVAALQSEAEADACELRLRLDGLSCLGCAWLVEHLFQRMPGAKRVHVSVEERRIVFGWFPGCFDAVGFLALLQSFGYRASPYRPGLAAAWSPLTWRLLLCAVFAANGAFLAFADHLLQGAFASGGLLHLLGMLFALLSLLVGGAHFIVPAVRSVRVGIVHYDLLAALGLLLFPFAILCDALGGASLDVPIWKLPVVVFILVLARWLHVRLRPRLDAPEADRERGLGAARLQFWMQTYVYSVLGGTLLSCIVVVLTVGAAVPDLAVAALLASALYPLARVADLRPHWWLFAAGLGLAACGVFGALLGLLGPLTAALWMLMSGLVWHGLSAFVYRGSATL